jgi:Ca2+-binding RTX toxin-like protein
MRRILVVLATMVMGVLLASGVAWAANITCTGGPCTGTEQNDQITGSLLDDQIQALGGRDEVNARSGDDEVDGGRGGDDIFGRLGADLLSGGGGPDDIDGGRGTPDGTPIANFTCSIGDPEDPETEVGRTEGNQLLEGDDGNDDLDGGIDNDFLEGNAGRNDLSGNGGGDCLGLSGDANERASGGDGDDLFFTNDGNADDVICGAGIDTVLADENPVADRVAADCEHVFRRPPPLQATGATPVGEVTITTPEGTTTTTP